MAACVWRNLSASRVIQISASGPTNPKAMRHAVSIMGVEHVALGSDFDGATTEPWDTRALGLITEGLLKDGFAPDDVRRIMGSNVLAFLSQQLPTR